MELEELGMLFKHDPLFKFYITELPKGHFLKIVELRRKRQMNKPTGVGSDLGELLQNEGFGEQM